MEQTFILKVKSSFELSEEEFLEEILKVEVKLNTNSKLRFHLEAVLPAPIEVSFCKTVNSSMEKFVEEWREASGILVYKEEEHSLLERIQNEKDPILRQVMSYGYHEMITDVVDWKVSLVDHRHNYIKKISLFPWREVINRLEYYEGANLAGGIKTFISAKNGALKELTDLIVRPKDWMKQVIDK